MGVSSYANKHLSVYVFVVFGVALNSTLCSTFSDLAKQGN